MSAVAQKTESEANVFQKYLIPPNSCGVRWAMQKAGEYGTSENFIQAHITSVAFAISAVVMSFFNALSYFLLIPCYILVDVFSFSPIALFTDIFTGIANSIQSWVFVSLGVSFVAAGLLFPDATFSHFAPEYYQTLDVRHKNRVGQLEKENSALREELDKTTESLDIAMSKIQEYEGKGKRKWFGCF